MGTFEEKTREFVKRVLTWGKTHRRLFPWRETSNPYKVLIAEVMLHRTKAEQVLPIYSSFIKKFPNSETLANTTVDRIEKEIKSLGLSYRASRLKRIGELLVERHKGQVPSDYKSLRELPGVGPYIANAVLCFAFGQKRPILDTNVVRVISRFFGIPISSDPHKNKSLWNLMDQIVPQTEAREFNLTVLDLAALVCKAKKPEHNRCPLTDICYARTPSTCMPEG